MNQDLRVERSGHVALVEFSRPPHNYFDLALLTRLSDAFEALDADETCRALVLCSSGPSFCAGASLGDAETAQAISDLEEEMNPVYVQALRLFQSRKPVVAAIQGAAIGGGLGLALAADFRVTCEEARFSANFSRLGFYPGFGLSLTLPRVVGPQQAALLLYTGRRISGADAVAAGLADYLVKPGEVRAASLALAQEIAGSAPLTVQSVRAALRREWIDRLPATLVHESAQQKKLFETADFREGVAAAGARRPPLFTGC